MSTECKILVMEDLPQSILKNDEKERVLIFPSINLRLNKVVLGISEEKNLSYCLEENIYGKKY